MIRNFILLISTNTEDLDFFVNSLENVNYIIDNYIDLKTLVLLKNISNDVKVIIFTDNINKGLHKKELDDFINEYPGIKIGFICVGGIIHDRHIIVDYNTSSEKIYHCGASSKDSGKRINTIMEINDKDNYHLIINKLLNNNKLVI